jgi:hypothetical protein
MAKPSIKPKATIVWSEQTEKLKRKFSSFAGGDMIFDNERMNEILSGIQRRMASSQRELLEAKL